ncbi:hypothetical protein KAR91_45585 [Candidatus Pacearchaeota archaeon]|nr:hypothetical protein [Candidatus Pacearchaeota archaeon]
MKIKNNKIILVVLLSMVFITSCQQPPAKHSVPNPNIHFSDTETQAKLINLLKQNNIPYKIEQFDKDKNNYIVWEPQYDKEVISLIKNIYKGKGESSPTNISFVTEEQNKYFVTLLEENGIPYRIVKKDFNGELKTNIEYISEDESKIRDLKIRVLKEKPINIAR